MAKMDRFTSNQDQNDQRPILHIEDFKKIFLYQNELHKNLLKYRCGVFAMRHS